MKDDNGISVWDQFRSVESVPVTPQGSALQGLMRTPSHMDKQQETLDAAQRFGGYRGFSCEAFSYQASHGGSTLTPGGVLSSDPNFEGEYPGLCCDPHLSGG